MRRKEVWRRARCAITASKFSRLFFSKLLVVFLGSVSVDEFVSVENTPSARLQVLDKYPRKLMVSGLMEKIFDSSLEHSQQRAMNDNTYHY